MVKRDQACSFLSSICVRDEIKREELAAVPIKGGEMILDIDIAHLKGKTLSPAATTFLNFLLESRDLEDLGRTADLIGDRGKAGLTLKAVVASRKESKRLQLVEGLPIRRNTGAS